MRIELKNKERAEKMADIFRGEDYYDSKNPCVKWLNSERINHILKLAGNMETKKILDAGTGDGFMLERIKCKHLYAIDISEKRCGRAKKKVPNAFISVQDLQHMTFEDNFFDGIICADVLEHIETPEKAVAEMIRIVKNNGFIIISIPNEVINIIARVLFLRFPIINPDHIHFLSTKFLKKIEKWTFSGRYNIPDIPDSFSIHNVSRWTK